MGTEAVVEAVEVVEDAGDVAAVLLKEGEEDVVVVIKIAEVVGVVVPLLKEEEAVEDEGMAVSVAEVAVMELEATFVAASAVLEVAVEVSTAEEDSEEVEVEDHPLTSHVYSRKFSLTCVHHGLFILTLAALDLFPSLTTPSRSSRMRW